MNWSAQESADDAPATTNDGMIGTWVFYHLLATFDCKGRELILRRPTLQSARTVRAAAARNAPDFLTPVPRQGEAMGEVAARIAATPGEEVDYQLDIAIRGRRVWPHVLALHPSEAAYERWRRPMPPALETVAREGGAAVATAAATAMATLFESVLAPDWPRVRAIVEADISNRADRMAAHGAAAVLDDLGERMQWTGTELVLERTYSGIIDWADEGVLFVPATTHVGPVLFAAERPHPPMLIYRARGMGVLGERPAGAAESALAGLVGVTRAALLTTLDVPASTAELSRRTGWSNATVSYHLGILLRAGLVDRYRRGRVVHYARTSLGAALATSSEQEQASRDAQPQPPVRTDGPTAPAAKRRSGLPARRW
ncbi:winged helix-turn-helix domain-containing protein [Streptomyces sp. NPDC050145]|uniref:winged helix-turn-helix domain-containing protein n=1 Tax=Streptomyces sp. NPDC050145 TaxID=3365602 RepID=UPI0037AF29C0